MPPDKLERKRVAPLKTSGDGSTAGAHAQLGGDSPRQNGGGADPKASPKATPKKKNMVIKVGTAANLCMMAATAASVLQPASSIMLMREDAVLHLPVADYGNFSRIHEGILISDFADDNTHLFRLPTRSLAVV